MTDNDNERPDTGDAAERPRFPELEEIQREVERRIRDNRKFLEKFLDEDYVDEEGEAEDGEEDIEEL